MSKGNASIHLRTLEAWGAVTCSWKPGTRKDYYAANRDLRGLALKRFQEGSGKRLQTIRHHLEEMRRHPSDVPNSSDMQKPFIQERIKDLESLVNEAEAGFALLPRLMKLKNYI
jgi:DNA-binding transcriptional regulator GbsR (MarR family)